MVSLTSELSSGNLMYVGGQSPSDCTCHVHALLCLGYAVFLGKIADSWDGSKREYRSAPHRRSFAV